MTTTINADTATGGAIITGDASGVLALQAAGVTGLTLNSSRAIGVGASPDFGSLNQILQSNGSSAAPTWVTPASATAATQAQMEAASSNAVFATPLNTNFSPGVAKAWLKCDAAGAIQVSHNITSITDTATGQVTVTLNTDFSSADYIILCTAESSNGNPRILQSSSNTVPTAGAFLISSFNVAGTLADSSNYYAACFGDQT